MKVFGRYLRWVKGSYVVTGRYLAFDAEWAHVETSFDDTGYFITLGGSYMKTIIKGIDEEYLDLDVANALLKDIVTKEVVDLDEYHMGLFGFWDARPEQRSICIMNELDDECNTIPLEVKVVES